MANTVGKRPQAKTRDRVASLHLEVEEVMEIFGEEAVIFWNDSCCHLMCSEGMNLTLSTLYINSFRCETFNEQYDKNVKQNGGVFKLKPSDRFDYRAPVVEKDVKRCAFVYVTISFSVCKRGLDDGLIARKQLRNGNNSYNTNSLVDENVNSEEDEKQQKKMHTTNQHQKDGSNNSAAMTIVIADSDDSDGTDDTSNSSKVQTSDSEDSISNAQPLASNSTTSSIASDIDSNYDIESDLDLLHQFNFTSNSNGKLEEEEKTQSTSSEEGLPNMFKSGIVFDNKSEDELTLVTSKEEQEYYDSQLAKFLASEEKKQQQPEKTLYISSDSDDSESDAVAENNGPITLAVNGGDSKIDQHLTSRSTTLFFGDLEISEAELIRSKPVRRRKRKMLNKQPNSKRRKTKPVIVDC